MCERERKLKWASCITRIISVFMVIVDKLKLLGLFRIMG